MLRMEQKILSVTSEGIKVHVERERDVQTFFTAGGFAFTYADLVTGTACVELIKLDDTVLIMMRLDVHTGTEWNNMLIKYFDWLSVI
uniref:AlNc14C29G2758 protein n=1 Tax=Albugo laibachii Nc14 TaxID=890382 RepID=F0W7E3_9STRA|nr:AlNc14C29G2758 [Albugo laibachii Nc14]|eukprot:CCA17042.1 AlNc14C29G2758 [Albugo laibachii Nc14]